MPANTIILINLKKQNTMPLLPIIIDLSHHNNVTSFKDVKNDGIIGVVHKATEAKTFVDSQYSSRRPRALAEGLLWGAYHFAARGDAQGQAHHFLDIVNPSPTDLLVLDFEPNAREGNMTLAEAETFITIIHSQTKRFPGIYSGQSFINTQLGKHTDTILKECFLWIARYSSELPIIPPAFSMFTIWQYTDGNAGPQPHQVQGIGRCDRDKFNGTEADLRKLWGDTNAS
jgi:lysozyme